MALYSMAHSISHQRIVRMLHRVRRTAHRKWNTTLYHVARESAAALDQQKAVLDGGVFAAWVHSEFTFRNRSLIAKQVFTSRRGTDQQIVHMFGANGLLSDIPSLSIKNATAWEVYDYETVVVSAFTVPQNTSIPPGMRLRKNYTDGTETGLFAAVFLQYLSEQHPRFLPLMETLLNDTLLPDADTGIVTSVPYGYRAVVVQQAIQNAAHDLFERWFSGKTTPSAADWTTVLDQFSSRVIYHSTVVAEDIHKHLGQHNSI